MSREIQMALREDDVDLLTQVLRERATDMEDRRKKGPYMTADVARRAERARLLADRLEHALVQSKLSLARPAGG